MVTLDYVSLTSIHADRQHKLVLKKNHISLRSHSRFKLGELLPKNVYHKTTCD